MPEEYKYVETNEEDPFDIAQSMHLGREASAEFTAAEGHFDELDDDMRQSLMALSKSQNIKTSLDLYEHYRDKSDAEITRKIEKDLKRTVVTNKEFNIDYKTGNNKLFNILNAYAMYDHEVSYCQGMNFIVALLLNHL